MLKRAFEKTKYEVGILLFLLLQVIFFLPEKDGIRIWQLLTYLGDYSHGYMPRALIGDIISRFTDTVTIDLLFTMSLTVCVLICVCIALVGGYLIRNAENPSAVRTVIAVMISSPVFMPLMASWLGIADIFLILLTVVAFILNENKITRFFVPVVMLTCVSIHHAYMFLYMVPVAIALLYDFFRNKKYVRDGILCGVTYASLIALALITLKTRSADGFSSVEEMTDYMIQKAGFPLEKEWLESLVPNEYFTGVEQITNNLTPTMSVSNLLGLVLIFGPLFAAFACGWVMAIRHSDDKGEKFVLSLCLIHPLSAVPAYVLGLNWNRWTSAVITSQCLLWLFMLHRKNSSVSYSLGRITEFLKNNFIFAVLYFIYYASFAKLLG